MSLITMPEDISKYGFFIVICIEENGTRSLSSDYDGIEYTVQFKSEQAAKQFVEDCEASLWGKNCKYYYKYVSWSMYD